MIVRILVFAEGTVLVHRDWAMLTRSEIVRLVGEGRPTGDYAGSVPIGDAVAKLRAWKRQGADIVYLTSRRKSAEVDDIRGVLTRFGFPEGELCVRQPGERYSNVAERVMPDVLVEDDCESIGGEVEMTYPHIRPELKPRIKSVVVREFGGIDHLPDDISALVSW